jgi:glycosyltransferase involved in cell wall biosynthesis
MEKRPLVSIVTVCYNSEKAIEDTLKSVLNQTYQNIEYIIIDGESTDSTMEIVRSYSEKFPGRINYISEKDDGIYDAMNKGVLLAKGEIIGIINSDDFYTGNTVIEEIVNEFTGTDVDCVYADLEYVDEHDTTRIVRVWKTHKGDFKKGWNPPHPSTFIKKSVYDRFGLYKKEYKLSSDYDFLYRIIEIGKITHSHLNRTIVHMRVGGRSTSGIIRSNLLGSREIYNTLKDNNQKWKIYIVVRRILNKITQFF